MSFKKLKQLQNFLEDRKLRGIYSTNTLKAYEKDISLYNNFLKQNKPLSYFYEYISGQGFSNRSKARIISSVRSYLRFVGTSDQVLRSLHPVPIKTKLPRVLLTKDFERIYQSAVVKNIHKTKRNQSTLLLLFGLGCRISEVTNLNLQDLNEMEQSLVVTGKRNKQRLLPLTNILFQALTDYIRMHRVYLIKSGRRKGGEVHSLIINNRGKRPTRVDIWRWLSGWSKKAGFAETKGPHQFRHGFATSLLENGADLRSIQFLLGHSSIHTTQIYTSVQTNQLKKTISEHHPLSD